MEQKKTTPFYLEKIIAISIAFILLILIIILFDFHNSLAILEEKNNLLVNEISVLTEEILKLQKENIIYKNQLIDNSNELVAEKLKNDINFKENVEGIHSLVSLVIILMMTTITLLQMR